MFTNWQICGIFGLAFAVFAIFYPKAAVQFLLYVKFLIFLIVDTSLLISTVLFACLLVYHLGRGVRAICDEEMAKRAQSDMMGGDGFYSRGRSKYA